MICTIIVLFAAFFSQTPLHEALCIGIFASLSSTQISLRSVAPQDRGEVKSAEANLLLGVLVTQDTVLACLLAALPSVFKALRERDEEDESGAGNSVAVRSSSVAPGTGEDHPGMRSVHHDEAWFESHLMYVVMCAQVTTLLVVAGVRWRRRWPRAFSCLPSTTSADRASKSVSKAWHSLVGQHAAGVVAAAMRLDDEAFALGCLSFSFALAYATDAAGLSFELGAFIAGLTLSAISRQAWSSTGVLCWTTLVPC
eukprot:TRINITY_DN21020_c0_g1_i1.p1 TRINITY_DN21020_c0_g1~~TRINITY_DN21020_c0_g1_i1.p1  ORF type:complete len:255 (-),score=41.76 TRINITY_DN21020_c0_g1_i1:398-1162(-)